jgi:hypothetical protein
VYRVIVVFSQYFLPHGAEVNPPLVIYARVDGPQRVSSPLNGVNQKKSSVSLLDNEKYPGATKWRGVQGEWNANPKSKRATLL